MKYISIKQSKTRTARKHYGLSLLVPAIAFATCLFLIGDKSFGQTTLFKAGTIHTMAGEPVSPGQILVVDGKIKSVGNDLEIPEGTKTIDLGEDAVVIPGLVNAYSQTALAEGSSDEISNEVTPNFRAANGIDWAKSDLKRELENGTTTMNVCPGTQNVIAGIAAVIKTDGESKTTLDEDGALLTSMCNDPASRNRSRTRPDSVFVRQPTNRMGVVWILRNSFTESKEKADAKDPVFQTIDGKRKIMMVSRMSFDINTVGTLSEELGIPSPIIVGGQEAYKIKDILAEKKFPIVLQPLQTGTETGLERSEVCWNVAGVLHEAGIPIALTGTDLLEQAQFAHRFGLDRNTALAAITSTPAKILGVEKRVGTIESDKDADLVVLSGDPLEITTSIRWVIVNGKIIDKNKDQ